MPKQKLATKRGNSAKNSQKPGLAQLHRRRMVWFGVLSAGLILIQLAYNYHSMGQPRVLGYATSMSTSILLRETNDYRNRSGLPPLNLNESLDSAAQAKADSMIKNNFWSHVAPDGTTPWYYFQKVGYSYSLAGENLAYGFSTSEQVVTAWMNSQEHRDNILGNYSDIGFGFANGEAYQGGNNTVVVAFYGQPSGQKPLVTASSATPTNSSQASAAARPATASHVNGATTVLNGSAPWATYASLMLIGATLMGFLVTHLEALRLGFHSARRYAVVHPTVDAAVLMILIIVVVQTAGGFIQ